jgi:cell division protein FtsB
LRRATPTLGGVRAAAAVGVLLLALGLVVWRQSRALEALAEVDQVRSRRALLEAERTELERRIQTLESRGWVLREAERRLGLRTPQAGEIVILPGASS